MAVKIPDIGLQHIPFWPIQFKGVAGVAIKFDEGDMIDACLFES
jgi:hypothetical protein